MKLDFKAGDEVVIACSLYGNEGRRCKLIERYDRLGVAAWWGQLLDGSGREGLLPEGWMQAEPERTAA